MDVWADAVLYRCYFCVIRVRFNSYSNKYSDIQLRDDINSRAISGLVYANCHIWYRLNITDQMINVYKSQYYY